MKQIEVRILKQSYLLGCQPGQEERLLEAAARVDEAMTRIQDAGKVRARERIAVLAALNLAFELSDLRQELEEAKTSSLLADTQATVDAQWEHALQGVLLSAGAGGTSLASSISAEDEIRLRGLISRIDQALGADSQ